ncbi:MAG TPA: MerR family transcriptional regulator [Aeromicrobium sp.]|nr:MerR family transcriptional regulator [Aeromicrobium sp.]
MDRRWTVGTLSQLLQIAGPTLRTWERRYGIGPTHRTPGGHRRYTIIDADRVATMSSFIAEGMAPRDAAELVKKMSPAELAAAVAAGEDGRTDLLREHQIAEFVSAAAARNPKQIAAITESTIGRNGIAEAWDQVIAVALTEIRAGTATGAMATATEELVRTRVENVIRALGPFATTATAPKVVVAALSDPIQSLPIAVTAAVLAQAGCEVTDLGGRVDSAAVAAFVDQAKPEAVILCSWRPAKPTEPRSILSSFKSDVVLVGSAWPESANPVRSMIGLARQVLDQNPDELP